MQVRHCASCTCSSTLCEARTSSSGLFVLRQISMCVAFVQLPSVYSNNYKQFMDTSCTLEKCKRCQCEDEFLVQCHRHCCWKYTPARSFLKWDSLCFDKYQCAPLLFNFLWIQKQTKRRQTEGSWLLAYQMIPVANTNGKLYLYKYHILSVANTNTITKFSLQIQQNNGFELDMQLKKVLCKNYRNSL